MAGKSLIVTTVQPGADPIERVGAHERPQETGTLLDGEGADVIFDSRSDWKYEPNLSGAGVRMLTNHLQ